MWYKWPMNKFINNKKGKMSMNRKFKIILTGGPGRPGGPIIPSLPGDPESPTIPFCPTGPCTRIVNRRN